MGNKMTAKKAAYWISEAWGRDVPPSHCRIRGNWLFVWDKVCDEVECIPDPNSGDLWGEPWDSITRDKSPFNPNVDVSALLSSLDVSYLKYLEDCR